MAITSIEGALTLGGPRRAFESLLFSEPRGAAVFMMMSFGNYPQRWEEAVKGYRDLVARYGEDKVLAVADKLLTAEKTPLGLIDIRPPRWWFGQLLENPAATLPGPMPRFAISDIAGLKAAVGKTVIARGTVSHVIMESGGGAVVYLRLYFKESGTEVSARTYGIVPTFERRYGERGAGIVGKTIEVTSDFWELPEGILFRVTDIGQIRVVQ